MKTKSLFISTIAMVVLLVVALATGTFAWYSASQTATAGNATVSSAASTSASIGLYWAGDSPSAAVSFGKGADIGPMIPTVALADYNTVTPTGSAPAFTTALIGNNGTNDYFKTNGTTGIPWEQINDDGTSNVLTIQNVSFTTAATVTATVSIPQVAGTNSDILRVAIYIEAPTGYFDLIGVWGPTETSNIWFGTIVQNANVNSIQLANDGANIISPSATSSAFSLAARGTAVIHVYAWLEGTILDSERSLDANYGDATFSVTFNATEA